MLKQEKKSIIISLGDDGAIIGYYSGNKLLRRMFVTSPTSSDFVDALKQFGKATIYILLDTIDQNYIFSNIPSVGKGSVNKIIKRKLESEFDQHDLNSYIFLGKEKTPTKIMLRYLFISIRNSNPFKVWVEAVSNLPNDFGGIYLVPLESEVFINKLRQATHGDKKTTPDEWEILVSYNRVGGLRQVVLKNGRLIFTRISQAVSLQTPDAVGKSASQESANTLEYIRRIGFYDQNISIYIVSSKESSNFIDIPGVKTKDIYHYSPYELSQKLGIEQSAQESDKFGDVVFATSFISGDKKILKVATPYMKQAQSLVSASKLLTAISAGLMALFAIGSLYMLISGYIKTDDIKDSDAKIKVKLIEFEGLKSFEKEYGIKPENLKDAVKFKELFSNKDKKYFDIIKKYKEVDVFSKNIKSVSFMLTDKGKANINIAVVFDLSEELSYSDILGKFEQYKVTIIGAFIGYTVSFNGLPSESGIKVDLENTDSNKESIKEIMVSISDKDQR